MKALVVMKKGVSFDTFFPKENMEYINSLGEITFVETKEEVLENISDCQVYITGWNSPRLDEEILEKGKNLRLLAHTSGSVAGVVSDAMWERGIKVISGNNYFAESVAEGTIGLILSATRRIPQLHNKLSNEGIWPKSGEVFTDSLLYKTVGIISYGAVARHLVKMLSVFKVNIKVYDIVEIPKEEREKYNFTQCSMEEIFSTCDIISVHTPLNENTYHLIDDKLLSMLRKDSYFINTSRGKVIDQKALTKHLINGDFYAALDVFEVEPVPRNDGLLGLSNVVLSPHKGGPTVNLRKDIARKVIKEAADYIDYNKPLINEITKQMADVMTR